MPKSSVVVFVALCTLALAPGSASGIGESANTFLVSVAPGGGAAVKPSSQALLSADGRFVALESSAGLAGGTSRPSSVFVRDRSRGVTRQVSLTTGDRPLNDVATVAAISATGNYVLFDSQATNVGPGDGKQHTYIRDRARGATRRVLPAGPSSGERGIEVSAAGRFVSLAFDHGGQTMLMLKDRRSGAVRTVGRSRTVLTGGRMSGAARQVFFARGTKLLVWTRATGRKHSVPLPAAADLAEAVDISDNGRYVLFVLYRFDPAGNVFSEAYVRDRSVGATTRVTVGPAPFSTGVIANSLSDDGRYVAFESGSSAFVAGDGNGQNDAFVRDLEAGQTIRVSVAAEGSELAAFSAYGRGPALSADGRVAAFSTPGAAVPADTNRVFDVFVRQPLH